MNYGMRIVMMMRRSILKLAAHMFCWERMYRWSGMNFIPLHHMVEHRRATMKIRCKFKLEIMVCSLIRHFLLIAIMWCGCCLHFYVGASEFPERECCDPIYHPVPSVEPLPALSTTDASASSSMSGGGLTSLERAGKKCIYC